VDGWVVDGEESGREWERVGRGLLYYCEKWCATVYDSGTV
jgi:hypothetical protein